MEAGDCRRQDHPPVRSETSNVELAFASIQLSDALMSERGMTMCEIHCLNSLSRAGQKRPRRLFVRRLSIAQQLFVSTPQPPPLEAAPAGQPATAGVNRPPSSFFGKDGCDVLNVTPSSMRI